MSVSKAFIESVSPVTPDNFVSLTEITRACAKITKGIDTVYKELNIAFAEFCRWRYSVEKVNCNNWRKMHGYPMRRKVR